MLQEITIHELVIAITIVFISVLLLIIVVLFYSIYKYRLLHNRQIWTHIIENKIIESIAFGQNFVERDESFEKHLRDPAFRSLFLDLLVTSERKFSGAAREEITHLFHKFNLEEEAWRNLRKRKSYLIAGGIQELTAMRVIRALPDFTAMLTHAEKQVYQEAQYGVVSFIGVEGLHFLDYLVQPLSDWQQLRLLNSITEIPNPELLNINLWLTSDSSSVIIFALRLIRKFQLLSFYIPVMKLLIHDVVAVRVQAVRTLQAFENNDTINQLIASFPNQPQEVQIAILKVFKLSRSMQSEGFLKTQLWEHPDTAIKIWSAEVLVALGQRQYLRDIAIDERTPIQYKQIINHALQEKVC
ncbi:hypothetical protein ACFX5U_10570 [Sphingobacterium sp. SG20118]|uniref:hypothetical protein n=1 Tax=Sphingobacterium sp. SG20118 TaxID=3367156 RepID=UPI0037DFC806